MLGSIRVRLLLLQFLVTVECDGVVRSVEPWIMKGELERVADVGERKARGGAWGIGLRGVDEY